MKRITVSPEISLQPVDLEHTNPLFWLIEKNREHLSRWIDIVNRINEIEDAAKYIKALNKSGEYSALIFFAEEPVGYIGFKRTDKLNKSSEIGYWIDEDYEGKGIVLHSCRTLIDYGINEKNLHRVVIKCATENLRSISIPQKLGFLLEGIERQSELIGGIYYDMQVFSILKHEWELLSDDKR